MERPITVKYVWHLIAEECVVLVQKVGRTRFAVWVKCYWMQNFVLECRCRTILLSDWPQVFAFTSGMQIYICLPLHVLCLLRLSFSVQFLSNQGIKNPTWCKPSTPPEGVSLQRTLVDPLDAVGADDSHSFRTGRDVVRSVLGGDHHCVHPGWHHLPHTFIPEQSETLILLLSYIPQ